MPQSIKFHNPEDILTKNANRIFVKARRFFLLRNLKRSLTKREERFGKEFLDQLKPIVADEECYTAIANLMIRQSELFVDYYNQKDTKFFNDLKGVLKRHPEDAYTYLNDEEKDFIIGFEILKTTSKLMHLVNDELKKDGVFSNFANTDAFDKFLKEKCVKEMMQRIPENYFIQQYEFENKVEEEEQVNNA